MTDRLSQVSIEFIFMIISATMMIVVFSAIFSELHKDDLATKKAIIMKDFAYSLQNEFIIAAYSKIGYEREFEIPSALEGFTYQANLNGRWLIVNYTDNMFMLPIPNISGNLVIGKNTIKKTEDTICLNCP